MEGLQDDVSPKSDGKTLASWSLPSCLKTVDSKRFKDELSKIYERILKTGVPQRTFRIYAQ